LELRPHRGRRRDRDRRGGRRRGRLGYAMARQRSGERSGVRRAYGPIPLGVPRRAGRRRSGRRHLGRRLVEVFRRPWIVVLPQRGRGSRARVRALHGAHRRLLRRASPRRQPLLEQPRCDPGHDRGARLALPDGASRPLGVRYGRPPDARRHHGRGPTDSSGHAAEQDRVRVRLRPRNR